MDECACVVSVWVVLCNLKKDKVYILLYTTSEFFLNLLYLGSIGVVKFVKNFWGLVSNTKSIYDKKNSHLFWGFFTSFSGRPNWVAAATGEATSKCVVCFQKRLTTLLCRGISAYSPQMHTTISRHRFIHQKNYNMFFWQLDGHILDKQIITNIVP